MRNGSEHLAEHRVTRDARIQAQTIKVTLTMLFTDGHSMEDLWALAERLEQGKVPAAPLPEEVA
jgi:hypothetical protein